MHARAGGVRALMIDGCVCGWVCGRALQLSEETVSVTFDLD